MSGTCVAQVPDTHTDAAKFEDYRSRVAPMLAKFGVRYLTKGGSHKNLEKGAVAA